MDGETTDLVLAAFDLPEKIVKSVMTPIDKIFMLSDQSVIDNALLKAISAKGRTRIPIYSGRDRNTVIPWIVSFLLKNSLENCDIELWWPINFLSLLLLEYNEFLFMIFPRQISVSCRLTASDCVSDNGHSKYEGFAAILQDNFLKSWHSCAAMEA